jgi:hypothetical protein
MACAAILLTILAFPQAHSAKQDAPSSDFTVHEWGTFTSISATDGQAIEWLPLTSSTDLPTFVEHLRDPAFKGGLRGTVRMETPVLYFYSPRETSVSVTVSFAKGLITEWYPHAVPLAEFNPRTDFSLDQKRTIGGITWNSVQVEPAASADFPRDVRENHYYAARETSSAPVRVSTPSGDQRERFLFYRGVSAFTPPIAATISADGSVLIQNHLDEEIPYVILFERRGSSVGYRILGPLRDEASLAAPPLQGSLDSLFSDFEGILISQGLHADEAHAMLETWKNSWFEEGSRLFYIVPRSFVDSVLRLSITPAPAATVRVFVGRDELITPATERAVESAFASGDRATLAKYSRFLEPILETMIDQSTDPSQQQRLSGYLESLFNQPLP